MNKDNPKLCFEHQCLRLGVDLKEGELKALQSFYGSGKDFPYYNLIHNGIKLCEYVGVIQVGKLVIEVLPKIDKIKEDGANKIKWQHILIDMLKVVGDLDVRSPGIGDLRLKSNSILEMYFEIFIAEVEYLVRTGILCAYRKNESNQNALKGRIVFAKHIQKNLVHQERFYTRSTQYDQEHIWHIILYQTIMLIKKLSREASLYNRIGLLELSFPPMPHLRVTAGNFAGLQYNRQTERYRKAIGIAKLILLSYHPDVRSGKNNVLALMFDMNVLWERFVYKSLRKYMGSASEYSLRTQNKHPFWITKQRSLYIKPDIVIKLDKTKQCWIWDTKWKLPKNSIPLTGDLQQMYSYAGILNSRNVALVYPGERDPVKGEFEHKHIPYNRVTCSVIHISVDISMQVWQEKIFKSFKAWEERTATE